MRVGITVLVEFSMFSSGATNTAIAIAELMAGLGHEVTLLNVRGKNEWWDDCKAIKASFNVKHLEGGDCGTYDILFEVGQLTLTKDQRASLGGRCIWILRKPFVLSETEMSIYPIGERTRDLAGLSQAWLLAEVTAPDDITAVETLAGVPVLQVPFLWTPIPAEVHMRSFGAPPWIMDPSGVTVVHMVDTNMTSASSSTIPLVALREAKRRGLPVGPWRIHNGEMIAKSRFFRDNVLKHCSDLDLSGQLVGRQRCVEWTTHPGSIAMAHLRFCRLRPVLLDLAWAGIPVIHNSPALRDMGCGAERFYYGDNSIREAADALENFFADLSGGGGGGCGWFSPENQKKRKEQLLGRWSPVSEGIRRAWSLAVEHTGGQAAAPVVSPAPVIATNAANATGGATATVEPRIINVVFSDMWESFQPDYNFFTLLLNEAGRHLNPPVHVNGHAEAAWTSGNPDLVIFGPFGGKWLRFEPSVPRVCFTGENTRPVEHPYVKLNLGHDLTYLQKEYLRIPHWLVSIDWFGADVDRLVNPRPIPLELATRTYENDLDTRRKFCAFVVTNPRNPVRNQVFHWASSYKPVDSGGLLYNTIGDGLAALQGGGGGEWKKTKFFMDYKFVIAYENESEPGYCTEKYLHAKAAGAIPIYWGDPQVQRDFDLAGAIDARECKTQEELVELIRRVDEDDAEWRRRAAVPALDSYRVDLARRTLTECARRMLLLAGVPGEALGALPRFLGAAPGSAEAKKGVGYFARAPRALITPSASLIAPSTQAKPELPVMVTFATFSFLGSLQHWLKALEAQTRAIPELRAIVFLGADVPTQTEESLKGAYGFAAFERVPSDWAPPDFPDFWEPGHYAWKIWIYNQLTNRTDLSGQLLCYADSGAVLVRWPKEWLARGAAEGVCCLEDSREENDRWCGDTFCERLAVTDEERAAKQIAAGLMVWRAGHPKAAAFFGEAFRLAQQRDILVGPRLGGQTAEGKVYGHRQDQSILSILVRRQGIPLFPLDTVYGHDSMRKTFNSGRCFYVHRGNFVRHQPIMPGIDDAFVINLDRRADRMARFIENHPDLSGVVERCPAVDGRMLALTPALARLFAPNDFFWKKSVMGCAASHLSLWWRLVNDSPDVESYLIFEDDAKMKTGWQEVVAKSMPHAPGDYDVLYLGGILPPNREAFETVLEPVTKYYSRVRPNRIFGQQVPTPYFHSCAYAYILSRRGAIKIMEALRDHGGYWTSADHIMCSPCEAMNLYFLTPTMAGCYQDDDPKYANADFNNFSRVDAFDSDLWNNDERFAKEEIAGALAAAAAAAEEEPWNLALALRGLYGPKGFGVKPVAPANIPVQPDVPSAPSAPSAHRICPPIPSAIAENKCSINRRFITFKNYSINFSSSYERDWLMYLFGNLTQIHVETVESTAAPPEDIPVVLFARPFVPQITAILTAWSAAGAKFKLLHLSDELGAEQRDDLAIYSLPGCVGVLRTYIRDDFPAGTEEKIQVVPLGYHFSSPVKSNDIEKFTPSIPFRELHWSFFGTDWNGRKEAMTPLIEAKLWNRCEFFSQWNDPAALKKGEYLAVMANTVFVPCPEGVNAETFRFYEALQAGCIPLVVKSKRNEAWLKWVSKYIPLMTLSSWEDALRVMVTLLTKPETLEIYRSQVLQGWMTWSATLQEQASRWLNA
jgi:GR25 family glycosyltransferase involved in LPS biosynthesis